MPKARVKFSVTASPSPDVAKRFFEIVINGDTQSIEMPGSVTEYEAEVNASSSVTFRTKVVDTDGTEAYSTSATMQIGDLEDVLADTDPTITVVAVIPDAPPPPPPPTDGGIAPPVMGANKPLPKKI